MQKKKAIKSWLESIKHTEDVLRSTFLMLTSVFDVWIKVEIEDRA